MSIKITKDMVPDILRALDNLTGSRVLVGIPGDAPVRTRTGVGISNAALGYIHEFGSPRANIPARPFLRPGVSEAMPLLITRLRAGARRALAAPRDPEAGTDTLHRVGLTAQNVVRRYINAGVAPPLSEATLHRRRTRKVAPRTGTVALIDTGQLRSSITYVIRPTR